MTMSHPNIIQLIDAYETDDLILMVLERAQGRDLQSIIDSRATPKFSEAVTRVIFEQARVAGL
jgi:serine/threonine protein kinase